MPTLEPLQLLATLEDVQGHFMPRVPGLEDELRRAGQTERLSQRPPEVLLECFLLCALDLPAQQAATRRAVALSVRSVWPAEPTTEAEPPGLRLEECPPGSDLPVDSPPWIDAERLEARLLAELPKLRRSRLRRVLQAAVERFAPGVRRVRIRQIDDATTLHAVLAHARWWLPRWPHATLARFLSLAGRPVPVPSARSMAVLQRLGWMPPSRRRSTGALDAPAFSLANAAPDGSTSRTLARSRDAFEFLAICEQVAQITRRTPAQVGLLIELLSGRHEANRAAAAPGPCGQRPQCDACPASTNCLYASISHEAQRPARAASAERPMGDAGSLSATERLMERAQEHGVAALTDAELLTLLMRPQAGTRFIETATRLLAEQGGLPGIDHARAASLARRPGLNMSRVLALKAGLELGRRLHQPRPRRGERLQTPEQVCRLVAPRMLFARQEIFMLLLLNTKLELMDMVELARGTLNSALVHPREAFTHAVAASAHAVIFVHNHPSGDPTPSQADREITRRLKQAGELLDIRMLDHLILGDGRFFSFSDDASGTFAMRDDDDVSPAESSS